MSTSLTIQYIKFDLRVLSKWSLLERSLLLSFDSWLWWVDTKHRKHQVMTFNRMKCQLRDSTTFCSWIYPQYHSLSTELEEPCRWTWLWRAPKNLLLWHIWSSKAVGLLFSGHLWHDCSKVILKINKLRFSLWHVTLSLSDAMISTHTGNLITKKASNNISWHPAVAAGGVTPR